MYAIVEIAGQQFKVEKDKYIYTNLLQEKEGAKVEFSNVLLVGDKANVEVGAPVLKGAKVSGKVLEHVKGEKLIVFKKKRRKGFKKKTGHRSQLTKVLIENITK